MTISELKRTADFVKQTVIKSEVPQKFQNLITVLQHNARAVQPGSGGQPNTITNQKAELIAAVKAIRIQALTLNERRLLKTFIDLEDMGDSGVEKITQIFSEHNLDPMGAVNAFSNMKTQYDKLIASASEIIKVLAPIDVPVIESDIEEGKAVLQINFKEKASIVNVTGWHDYSDDWWQIIRSVGLLTDTTTDDAKVLSFQQGSVVVEISALYLVVKAVGLMAEKSLDVIERMFELRKKIAEIRQLDLGNKKIERDLEKESTTFIETQSKLIGEKVITEINKAKSENGEVVNAINMAVDKLFKFLDKGGTVDCRLKQIENNPPEAIQLRDDFSKIRALETRVHDLKLITDGKSKDA